MNKKISRRTFLKGSAAAAAGLAASGSTLPKAAFADDAAHICTLLDLEKCIGCEECVGACREQWQSSVPVPKGPIPKPFPDKVPIEDWSARKDVQNRLTPYNFLYVEMLEVPHKGEKRELNIPRRCMHCTNPPCTNLCPFGAGRVERNGIVHIDKEVCFGGAKCKSVCPWHIPQRQSGVGIYMDFMPTTVGNGVMFKCHRCLPLVAKGEKPRCIEVCPEDVQSIGPRQEMIHKAIALAKEKAKADGAGEEKYADYIYGLDENGGTNTLYVSPVPFAEVNKALVARHRKLAEAENKEAAKKGEKAPKGNLGRPPMGRVPSSMASAKNLGWALLLAPVAGLVAGFTKTLAKTSPTSSEQGKEGKGGRS